MFEACVLGKSITESVITEIHTLEAVKEKFNIPDDFTGTISIRRCDGQGDLDIEYKLYNGMKLDRFEHFIDGVSVGSDDKMDCNGRPETAMRAMIESRRGFREKISQIKTDVYAESKSGAVEKVATLVCNG